MGSSGAHLRAAFQGAQRTLKTDIVFTLSVAVLGPSWGLWGLLVGLSGPRAFDELLEASGVHENGGPKMAPCCPMLPQDGPKTAPRRPQDGPKRALTDRHNFIEVTSMVFFFPTKVLEVPSMKLWRSVNALLGPSWDHLGPILGPAWGHLEPSWGHLGLKQWDDTIFAPFVS